MEQIIFIYFVFFILKLYAAEQHNFKKISGIRTSCFQLEETVEFVSDIQASPEICAIKCVENANCKFTQLDNTTCKLFLSTDNATRNNVTFRGTDVIYLKGNTENIDESNSDPCLNAGTSYDGVNSYRCECSLGFTGDNCGVSVCTINAVSTGSNDAGYSNSPGALVIFNDVLNETVRSTYQNRGITVIVVDMMSCRPVRDSSFDTYDSTYDDTSDFVQFVGNISAGEVFLLITYDEFTRSLTGEIRTIINAISNNSSTFEYRSSLSVAAVKQTSDTFCTLEVAARGSYQGPATIIVNNADIDGCPLV